MNKVEMIFLECRRLQILHKNSHTAVPYSVLGRGPADLEAGSLPASHLKVLDQRACCTPDIQKAGFPVPGESFVTVNCCIGGPGGEVCNKLELDFGNFDVPQPLEHQIQK